MTPAKKPRPKRCVWTEDCEGTWHTGCKNAWQFNEGGPSDNSVKFCFYCGKKLKVKK